MTRAFELFVARRYLRAKRKQTVISVITVISIVGVAAGVMALIIALAINAGFRGTLQRNLLGATAHVSILEKEPGYGIERWRELAHRVSRVDGVVSVAPSLYGQVLLSGPLQATGAVLKGIDIKSGQQVNDVLRHLKQGDIHDLARTTGLPGIILGSKLAHMTGMMLNSVVRVMSPQGELTPFGPRFTQQQFRVVGIFESGFYELDATWAYTTIKTAQELFSVSDVVNSIEMKVREIDRAPEIAAAVQKIAGPKLAATHWMEQNRPILNALKMERAVTIVTIGLIQLVAALNILIALIMMVMEKHKDIAILMSMGARHRQIRNIFVLQGVLIGAVGTVIGLALGYTLSFLADRYHWIRLDEEVYSLSYVPFNPGWLDGVWVAAIALTVSFVATLYPARNATRISPVEALRYE
ncbi:MAG: ABC transporter permease [Acidobacteria bacterium]|nr:ABC transporter permease [Acidobacteriota bacterium]